MTKDEQINRLTEELEELTEEANAFCRSSALYAGVVWGLAMGGNEMAAKLLAMKIEPTWQLNINYKDIENDLKK